MLKFTPSSWEQALLEQALEAEHQQVMLPPRPACAPTVLASAYTFCAALTHEHSRTFSLATRLLPPEKRRAMHALYAFCRVSDDLVDQPQSNSWEALATWRRLIQAPVPSEDDPVALAWAETRRQYAIPSRYVEQLLDSLARDLSQKRYRTFADVSRYAYGVASTVGLMSMHIIGFASEQAVPYAIKLGLALQLTNMLRDIGEDWRNGRLYLALEDLATYGVSEADLERGRVDERWRALLRFQIARARRFYAEARPGIALLHRDGWLAVTAASDLYCAILDQIEAQDYEVFRQRAQVSAWRKARRLPAIWWRSLGMREKRGRDASL